VKKKDRQDLRVFTGILEQIYRRKPEEGTGLRCGIVP
jgi:hypothetical protein